MFQVQNLSKLFSKKYYPQTAKYSQSNPQYEKHRIYKEKIYSDIRITSSQNQKNRRMGSDIFGNSASLFTVPDQLSSIPYRSNNNSLSISEEFIKSNHEKESRELNMIQNKQSKQNKNKLQKKNETVTIKAQIVKSTIISTCKQIIQSKSIDNRLKFMYESIPNNKILKLLINRNKNGLNLFWPYYNAVFANNNEFCLASMRKKISAAAASYMISTNSLNYQQNQQQLFVGKLKNYLLKNVYNIVNEGLNPNKATQKDKVREVIATIKCTSYIENKNILRKLEVYILSPKFRFSDLKRSAATNQQVTLDKLYELNVDKIILLKNRKPIWNEKTQDFLMDFSGRIGMASIKNFILENEKNQEVLMFGKVKEDQFSLEISAPISPLIGLGIICANIDFKVGYSD